MRLIILKEKNLTFLSTRQKLKTLIACGLLIINCITSIACSVTHPAKQPEAVKIWWGKVGDMEEFEKAKNIVENYDWIIMSQDIYKNQ